MSTSFAELADAVAAYYGTGSDQWLQIAQYGISSPEAIEILKQVPGVNLTISNSGKILGWDYNNSFGTTVPPTSAIDSNVQTGTYGAGSFTSNIPATAIPPSTATPNGTMNSGAISTSSGSVLSTLADKASLAVAGVALGAKLGKFIAQGIYSINPEWYDQYMPTMNPQTWPDLYATTEDGKQFVRTLFGIQNDTATMYLDERLLAYTYALYLQQGAWNGGGYDYGDAPELNETYNVGDLEFMTVEEFVNKFNIPVVHHSSIYYYNQYKYNQGILTRDVNGYPSLLTTSYNSSGGQGSTFTVDTDSHTVTQKFQNDSAYLTPPFTVQKSGGYFSIAIYDNVDFHGLWFEGVGTTADSFRYITNENSDYPVTFLVNLQQASGLDGVTDDSRASTQINPNNVINPTTGDPVTPSDNIDDILQALKNAYPDLFNDSIYTDVPQDDGTTERYVYIPVPYPNTSNPTQPTSDDTPNIDPQTQPQVDPQTRPETAQDITTQLAEPTTTSPDTGDGNTPPAIIPSGSASALYSIYNPSQGELNSFGAWLWSSNFVDQLLKLFNDPMQAIIGLHKVFAQPAISGASTIKVGYLDSGVSSNVVGNQYTTIDCGYVDIPEYFGNVFDYDPFTQVYIYLPFVGIEKLDTGDVMRGRVGVKYHVDVITGACLAEISVIRDGSGGILYTFTGNCAVQYPISSGSYMGIVASLASIAGGVVGTVASGGALAPVAMGAVSGTFNAHTRVQHSGGFSGNAGAMGVKIPYIIITRPQTCLADNFPAFNGYPTNKTTPLSACSGFVKCETCHVENVPATDAELSEIEMLLKGGIII